MEKLTITDGFYATITDSDGKKYLDFTSGGIFQCPFGICDEDLLEAVAFDSYSMYNAHYDNPDTRQLVDLIREWTGYESAVLFCTGAEATEAYWRAMRIYSGKPHIWGGLVDPDNVGKDIAPPDAMHGMTLGALIMAGKMTWPGMDPMGAFSGRYAQQYHTTSCAIWEPYHAPSAQFHKPETIDRLKTMQDKFPDIPHCSDEIQGGLGRTGKMFAYEWYDDLKPRFVTLGKMLGGGLPVSALLGPREILEDRAVIREAHLHSTHSGWPMGSRAAMYVINRIGREDLITRSLTLGQVLHQELAKIDKRIHSGKGLLAGIEFDSPTRSTLVTEACRNRGLLICDTGRKWVKVGPQLNIAEEEIVKGCAILKSAIEEVENEFETCGNTSGEHIGSGGFLPENESETEGVQSGEMAGQETGDNR